MEHFSEALNQQKAEILFDFKMETLHTNEDENITCYDSSLEEA